MDMFVENIINISKSVLVIDDDNDVYNSMKDIFKTEYYSFLKSSSDFESIDYFLEDSIHMIIINADNIKNDVLEITNRIRLNSKNDGIPIIVLSSISEINFQMEVLKNAEYCIKKPINKSYCYAVLKNISNLIEANKNISSLTGLPGCEQINSELKKRIYLKKPFVLLYIDLDNFKVYNDNYSFLKGNEVILDTAKIIRQCVKKYGNIGDFVGHIGGDDFIVLLDYENADTIANNIISLFENNLNNYYDELDFKKGYIVSLNRDGVKDKIPNMTMSIAFVYKKFNNLESDINFLGNIIKAKNKAKSMRGNSIFKSQV